ncbi:hypothetical protein [Rhizobium rhizogenes]|uniref:hypothetical protein n=1 Tax=Rhizobium rhizogenes TaxID=359 RepID=UPI0022B73995|nr:hypothetical protein [Rhizobium rhizogenes]MCZ7448277.1 hypothetical protein [Rhizobium rhizogenes]MCZ7465710.1 hypothetical protein [Rhizobium rhizogenes]
MPASDATCAAAVAFPKGNWKQELAALKAVNDPPEVIEVAIGRSLCGICNVVAAMEPERVRGLGEVIRRMPAVNRRLAMAATEKPLRDLGIGYQSAVCHPDITNAMMATTEGMSYALRQKIEAEVKGAVNDGAVVYLFVQPRMNSGGNPVSMHFTLQYHGAADTLGCRMIESFNFMKGDDSVVSEELRDHWKKHQIGIPGPRLPESKFERLFAPVPANTKLAVTDLTHLGPVDRDIALLGSTVFGIAANKPGTIVYACDKVLRLEVGVESHRRLEVLHRLGEQAYGNGHVTSFGLHTGPGSCLHIGAAALHTFFNCSNLSSLPLSQVFVLFCDHAMCAYSAREKGLALTDFAPNVDIFELVEPRAVKQYVLDLLDAPTMVDPRDPFRASFCSQYIRFREPHPCEAFNQIGVLILDAAAEMLERYAKFLEDGGSDDNEIASIKDVFGFI